MVVASLCMWVSVGWAQEEEAAPEFTYEPAGALVEGSGEGREDDIVYVEGMRFPLESAPAFLNSQVYGAGGFQGPDGGRECDEPNYSYPWRDNFCESRSWNMPMCPAGTGHQGQDIRPASCDKDQHWAVATVDGLVVHIGNYSVTLVSEDGVEHRYLHLEPASLVVELGSELARGDRIGRVSNTFVDSNGDTVPTTIHLHYDVQMNLDGANVFVSPYMSLVSAYEALLSSNASRCDTVPAEGRTIDDGEGCMEFAGPPKYWRRESVEGAIEGGVHWTNAHPGEFASNVARVDLKMAQAGDYTVEIHLVAPRNRATAVPVMVHHSGTNSEITLDQTSAEGWTELGTFAFAEGGSQWITLSDNTGEDAADRHIGVDAVRLTPAAE
ncbi:MAG: peptidoglycan DD-metalloendopeptidase family protein [Myxococcales bacterium]|nr:peptidoglycan DD-metalloendopeptidase family protein [Myxococcales bacterium]